MPKSKKRKGRTGHPRQKKRRAKRKQQKAEQIARTESLCKRIKDWGGSGGSARAHVDGIQFQTHRGPSRWPRRRREDSHLSDILKDATSK